MGKTKHVMVLDSDGVCGTVASKGVQVPVHHGVITDCKDLGVHFPFVQKALNRISYCLCGAFTCVCAFVLIYQILMQEEGQSNP